MTLARTVRALVGSAGNRGASRLSTAGAVIATVAVAAGMWLVFDQLWG
jgi:hypothetical protein